MNAQISQIPPNSLPDGRSLSSSQPERTEHHPGVLTNSLSAAWAALLTVLLAMPTVFLLLLGWIVSTLSKLRKAVNPQNVKSRTAFKRLFPIQSRMSAIFGSIHKCALPWRGLSSPFKAFAMVGVLAGSMLIPSTCLGQPAPIYDLCFHRTGQQSWNISGPAYAIFLMPERYKEEDYDNQITRTYHFQWYGLKYENRFDHETGEWKKVIRNNRVVTTTPAFYRYWWDASPEHGSYYYCRVIMTETDYSTGDVECSTKYYSYVDFYSAHELAHVGYNGANDQSLKTYYLEIDYDPAGQLPWYPGYSCWPSSQRPPCNPNYYYPRYLYGSPYTPIYGPGY